MQSTNLPWWQQVTALVSLSASGAVTGFTLAPNAAAGVTPSTSTQIRLLATDQASTGHASADQASTGQAGHAAAGNGTAHRAAAAPRPPEPARPAVPARGAVHSAGGSGASPATLASADVKLAQDDSALRPAIVNVASYYLRMAANKTPAEMEAIIWQHDSLNGADHGPSCAAFASLTLELGAQAVGQQSWVTGGGSYPWPLHDWADVRVDPNPASPGIMSVKQDAQAHGRWHPLGDGYQPRPGDWVLFDGHVEVVTQYSGGILHTIGGDSLPNFSVNAHEYGGSLAGQGIEGFVNNGELAGGVGASGQAQTQHQQVTSTSPGLADVPGSTGSGPSSVGTSTTNPSAPGRALSARGHTTPGSHAPAGYHIHHVRQHGRPGPTPPQNGVAGHELSESSVPGTGPTAQPAVLDASTHAAAAVPGLSIVTHPPASSPAALTTPYSRHLPTPPVTSGPDAAARRAFIAKIAPGAIATQRQYGIPASVTIAQAIDESGWGQSGLAVQAHNLFGIKGSGPAGRDWQVSEEFENGQYVTRNASFRVYNNVDESINDHGKLLATSGYYRQAMAAQHSPDVFASALTGVYATDPSYGAKLISLMRQYDLYRYDAAAAPGTTGAHKPAGQTPGRAAVPGFHETGATTGHGSSTGWAPPTPRPSNPARGSTTPPPPSSPPRTTPPAPAPPRIVSPPRGSSTPPTPPRPAPHRASAHPRTDPPRTLTPPETVTLPGLVAASGSVAAPGSVSPAGAATSHQTAALPGTGIATGTGLASGATAATGTAIQAPQPSGTGTGAQIQTGPHTSTGPYTSRWLDTGAGQATAFRPGTDAGPRPASGPATKPGTRAGMATTSQTAPRPTTQTAPRAEMATTSQTAPGSAIQPAPRVEMAASGPTTRTAPREGIATASRTAPGPATQTARQTGMARASQTAPRPATRTAHRDGIGPATRTAPGPATQASRRAAAAGTATKHRSPSPTAEIPGTTTAPGSATSPGHAPGGQHSPASHSGESEQDQTSASTQSASATRLSAESGPAKPISARLTAATVSRVKASAPAGQPARDNGTQPRDGAARPRRSPLIQYHNEMPNSVRTAFVTSARGPLLRAEPLYRDVASHTGIRWELLAACDWMQCEARPTHSPVHGEKLGVVNSDGTSYRTKSAALEQCADDLVELAGAVYGIDLLGRGFLSVRDLANVFAAFRWGGLLKQHRTSAMEFPYSVAGLTPDRMNMRWPNIAEPHAPDKPGARFRRPFGAVPVVLNLHYPVTA